MDKRVKKRLAKSKKVAKTRKSKTPKITWVRVKNPIRITKNQTVSKI